MFRFADPWETATAYPVPAAAQASFCLCTEATGAETSRDAAPPCLVGFFFSQKHVAVAPDAGKDLLLASQV